MRLPDLPSAVDRRSPTSGLSPKWLQRQEKALKPVSTLIVRTGVGGMRHRPTPIACEVSDPVGTVAGRVEHAADDTVRGQEPLSD